MNKWFFFFLLLFLFCQACTTRSVTVEDSIPATHADATTNPTHADSGTRVSTDTTTSTTTATSTSTSTSTNTTTTTTTSTSTGTGGNPPPGPQIVFTLASLSQNTANLSWAPAPGSGTITSYVLERSANLGTSSQLTLASPLATSFSDTPLQPSTYYLYKLTANGVGGTTPAAAEIDFVSFRANGDLEKTLDGVATTNGPMGFAVVRDPSSNSRTIMYTTNTSGNSPWSKLVPPSIDVQSLSAVSVSGNVFVFVVPTNHQGLYAYQVGGSEKQVYASGVVGVAAGASTSGATAYFMGDDGTLRYWNGSSVQSVGSQIASYTATTSGRGYVLSSAGSLSQYVDIGGAVASSNWTGIDGIASLSAMAVTTPIPYPAIPGCTITDNVFVSATPARGNDFKYIAVCGNNATVISQSLEGIPNCGSPVLNVTAGDLVGGLALGYYLSTSRFYSIAGMGNSTPSNQYTCASSASVPIEITAINGGGFFTANSDGSVSFNRNGNSTAISPTKFVVR